LARRSTTEIDSADGLGELVLAVDEFGDYSMCIVLSPLELGGREEVAIAAAALAEWYVDIYACHKSAAKLVFFFEITKIVENYPKIKQNLF
jgi:hypothetical protein